MHHDTTLAVPRFLTKGKMELLINPKTSGGLVLALPLDPFDTLVFISRHILPFCPVSCWYWLFISILAPFYILSSIIEIRNLTTTFPIHHS